jgi:hypothetical protein
LGTDLCQSDVSRYRHPLITQAKRSAIVPHAVVYAIRFVSCAHNLAVKAEAVIPELVMF